MFTLIESFVLDRPQANSFEIFADFADLDSSKTFPRKSPHVVKRNRKASKTCNVYLYRVAKRTQRTEIDTPSKRQKQSF